MPWKLIRIKVIRIGNGLDIPVRTGLVSAINDIWTIVLPHWNAQGLTLRTVLLSGTNKVIRGHVLRTSMKNINIGMSTGIFIKTSTFFLRDTFSVIKWVFPQTSKQNPDSPHVTVYRHRSTCCCAID